MAVTIEKAEVSDAKAILEFTKICGAETDNLSFGSDGIPVSLEQEENFIASSLDSNSAVFFVAKEGEEIVGTANYSVFSKERMAHRGEFGMSVKKSYWNKGIGTALLERILDFAKNTAKSEIVSLEVRSDNKPAIHLYSKFGFQKIGTFKGYFKVDGKFIDFDIMQLFL